MEREAPQLVQLWKPQNMVPFSTASASSLRNTWPYATQRIACHQLQYSWSTRSQFGAARSGCRPSTSSLSWRMSLSVFCISHFPHSLNIAQHQQRIAEKDETIAEKDKRIAFLVFCIVLLVAYLLRIQLLPHASATRGELWLEPIQRCQNGELEKVELTLWTPANFTRIFTRNLTNPFTIAETVHEVGGSPLTTYVKPAFHQGGRWRDPFK